MINNIEKKFSISYKASFKSAGYNNIYVWLAEPTSCEYQSIESFDLKQKPNASYKYDENLIHFFDLSGKNIELSFDLVVELKKKMCGSEKLYFDKIPQSIKTAYLKSEKYLKQTKEIVNLTSKITKHKETADEKIRSIFHYVAKEFKYCYPVKNRGVENLDFSGLRGDCAEYSSLFVTMCRISGIAARNVTGFVIFENENQIKEHGWAQVYTDKGWLDVDPQYASLEKNIDIGTEKYLFNRIEYRIVFTKGFNISLKPSIPAGFDMSNMVKLDLPMDRKNAQVLQPLVFASKSKTKFISSIYNKK